MPVQVFTEQYLCTKYLREFTFLLQGEDREIDTNNKGTTLTILPIVLAPLTSLSSNIDANSL